MQEAVCYNLKNKKIDCIRIDGKTPQKIRQELVNYFQETPTCRVACLSITAAGVGLTLTAASMYVACNIDKLDSCCVVSGVTHSCTTESSSPSSTGIQAYGGIRYAILGTPLTITLWRWGVWLVRMYRLFFKRRIALIASARETASRRTT